MTAPSRRLLREIDLCCLSRMLVSWVTGGHPSTRRCCMNQELLLQCVILGHPFVPNQWWCYDSWDTMDEEPVTGHKRNIMWVYRQQDSDRTEFAVFAVGYYTPERKWMQDSTWDDRDAAAARVHWLNGGD